MKLSNVRFLHKTHHPFARFRALCVRAILNMQSSTESTKTWKAWPYVDLGKGKCSQYESWNMKANSPQPTSTRNMYVGGLSFSLFGAHWKSTQSIDFEVTNTFQWVGEVTNTKSANDEHRLYALPALTMNSLKPASVFYCSLYLSSTLKSTWYIKTWHSVNADWMREPFHPILPFFSNFPNNL